MTFSRTTIRVEPLRKDQDFVLYRGHSNEGNPSSILLLTTLSRLPTSETFKQIEHEYSLKNQLDTTWAARADGFVPVQRA